MSLIIRAPTTFLNAIVANPATLRLYYSAGPVNASHDVLIAAGAAAAAFINAGSQILTGLPTYGPALATNARAYRLQVPASQAIAASLNLERDIELGEFCECQASDPKDLLALGFTPYTPTNSAPIPQIYG